MHFSRLFLTGILFCGLLFTGSFASAECVIHYKRTACAGQEKISYKKCGGKQECDKVKRADTKEECMEQAAKSCRNKRLEITKSKVITATWDGEELIGPYKDGDFCAPDREDFNKCAN